MDVYIFRGLRLVRMPIQKQNRFRNKWLFNLDRKQSLKRQEKRGYSCPSPFPTVIFSVISARYHQSQEDQHPWPRRQQHPKHLHWRLHSQGDGGLHLPRLHHLQQPLPGHRTEQTDRQSSSSTCTSWKEGLGQHHVDHQHQDEGVPGLRAQHAALR